MNQENKTERKQVYYNGRWVDKDHFRAFVYGKDEIKLANSYKEYENLIATGTWFSSKQKLEESLKSKARKPKDGGDS